MIAKIGDKVFKLALILIIGGIGGVLMSRLFLPYLATFPPFSQMDFFRQAGAGTTIINPVERVIVVENDALEQAIEAVSPRLVAIHSYQGANLLSGGTGFIVTSDGLIVTAANLMLENADRYLVFYDGRSWEAELQKISAKDSLALLKVEENNLPVVDLADFSEILLGQRIVLIGAEVSESSLNKFVNIGIVRSMKGNSVRLNLGEESLLANGSPLVDIKGKVIGLNLVDEKGLKETVPASKIRALIGI